MSLIPLSPPVAEPVSVAGAKARLRAGDDLDDAAVTLWIQAARERVERDTGRACLSQAWRERRDDWGGDGRLTAFASRFRLMKPPLIALDAVRIFSADGTPSEIDPAAFFVDTVSDPGRLVLMPGQDWPRPGRRAGGIEIDFTCGYGTEPADVPAPLREAVLQLVVAMAGDGPGAAMPPGVEGLLAPYRRVSL